MGEMVYTYFAHEVIDHRCIKCGCAIEGEGTVLSLRVDERGGVYEEVGQWVSWPCVVEFNDDNEMDP